MNQIIIYFSFLITVFFPFLELPAQITSDTEWSGKIVLSKTTYIDNHASLKIAPGSKIYFEKDVELIIQGSSKLIVNGDSLSPVIFEPLSKIEQGGVIQVQDIGSVLEMYYTEVIGSRVKILNGASAQIKNCDMHDYFGTGVGLDDISIFYANSADTITIQSSYFSKMYQVNIYKSPAFVENCLFEYWNDDAIDFDNSPNQTLVKNCTFRHGIGIDKDAIDFGRVDFSGDFPKGKVQNCLISDVTDKGVSIGEGAKLIEVNNCLIYNVTMGVAIKDSSTAIISGCTISKSEYGLALYEKNIGLGGGLGTSVNNIFWGNNRDVGLMDNSQLIANYTLTGNTAILGNENITDDPQFKDYNSSNFEIIATSPAYSSGEYGQKRGVNFPVGANYSIRANKINIGFPNYKSVWKGKDYDTIFWTSGENINSINIDISLDSGFTWQTLAKNIDASLGHFTCLAPNFYSNLCKIKISNSDNPNDCDITIGAFTINPIGTETSIPSFSHSSGFYTDSFNLTINAPQGTIIYYTLDGSIPSLKSLVYKEPIPIRKKMIPVNVEQFITSGISPKFPLSSIRTTVPSPVVWNVTWVNPDTIQNGAIVVRALAYKPGQSISKVITNTYWVNSLGRKMYSVPVISLTTDKGNLFDYHTGIYHIGAKNTIEYKWGEKIYGNCTQRGSEWEHPANIEFFESNGKFLFSNNVGIRIRGQWQQMYGQKTLGIYARSEYNSEVNEFPYELFPGYKLPNSSLALQHYKRLQLRSSGSEWPLTCTHIRDDASQILFKDLHVKISNYRPCILYINGEYWGLHGLREFNDKYSLHNTYGFDSDSVTIIEDTQNGRIQLAEGKQYYASEYRTLEEFIRKSDLKDSVAWEYVSSCIDIDNVIDHWIARCFLNNTNSEHNLVYWKLGTPYSSKLPEGFDGRWRWMLNDFDASFSNLSNDYTEIQKQFYPENIFLYFLKNKIFKTKYLNRFADLMNTNLSSNNVNLVLDSIHEVLKPLMQEQIKRWHAPSTFNMWNDSIRSMKEFAAKRCDVQRSQLIKYFSINGISEIELVCDSIQGNIKINSIKINRNTKGLINTTSPYPWKGKYFINIPIQLEAHPKSGYRFVKWKETNDESSIITFTPSDSLHTFTALFETVVEPNNEIIHYWSFNKNHSNTNVVETDYSVLQNARISYQGIDGYMDFTDNLSGSILNIQREESEGNALRFRNPSSESQLILNLPTTNHSNIKLKYAFMRTINGSQVQQLFYSIDGQKTWIFKESYIVNRLFELKEIDFTNIEAVNNNADFAVKIIFTGSNATLNEGNCRFDNISVEGKKINDLKLELAKQNKIRLYPNPSNSKFNLVVPEIETNDLSIELSSIDSKILKNIRIDKSTGNIYKIDISDLPSGIYFVQVKGLSSKYSEKIIKMK